MKKWLYMLLGVVVTIAGIWMGIHWWPIFGLFLLNVAIFFIIMAGVVILIVSFMIPAKEETFDSSDFDTDTDSDEEATEGCNGNCSSCGDSDK